MVQTPTRMPKVPHRRDPLSEESRDWQIRRGLYTRDRGEPFALPVDSLKAPTSYMGRELWLTDGQKTHRPGVQWRAPGTAWQGKTLAWLRDHVDARIPQWYYRAVLGHDVHVTIWGDLFGVHWHHGWADPFTGEVSVPLDPTFETLFKTHWRDHVCDLDVCPATWGSWAVVQPMLAGMRGFAEPLGWLSGAKVTDAFVSETVDELVSTTGTEFADFDFHEVGTSSQAEDNNDTALIATSGIARATGTPTDSDPIYQNVGTITADATETWEEHGLFNNSTSVALLDRSLTGGQSVNSSDQVQYTHQTTFNPEA